MTRLASYASFVFRAVVALALMVGFYALAFGLSAGLLYVPYAMFVYGHRLSLKLAALCLAAAFAILKGCVFVSAPPFEAPGPMVVERDEPELFRLVRDVAERMATRMPDRVYLFADVNAFVTEIDGFFGIGSRRVMGIGVGLLHVDNVSQLKATLAHEFGHYAGGDTRLGGLVYRTRVAIVRVLENLARSWLSKPFELYARLFIRVSRSVSREQELAADRAAIRVAGRDAHLSGLEAEARGAVLFDSFVNDEVVPLVDLGFAARNLFDGFARYHSELRALGAVEKVDRMLASQPTDPYDTHPSLPERLTFARAIASPDVPIDVRPALSLLANARRSEEDVSSVALGRLARGKTLESVGWSDVAAKAYAPKLAASARDIGQRVDRILGGGGAPDATLRALGDKLDRDGPLAVAMLLQPDLADAPSSVQKAIATPIVADAMGVLMGSLLVTKGGHWQSELGRAHQVVLGETLHEPFALARQVVDRPKELFTWLDAKRDEPSDRPA